MLYTLLEESHRTGVPLFRPLLLNYQSDYNTLNLDDEFMIGSDLLVAPVLKPGATSRMVYLPEGRWIDYWTGKRYSGKAMIQVSAPLEIVPMFVRAGAIIPMWPEMNYVGEKQVSEVTFEIYPAEKSEMSSTLYEDDGASHDYKRGVFRRMKVSASRSTGRVQIETSAIEGSYNPGNRIFLFVAKSAVTKAPLGASRVTMDGKPLRVMSSNDKSIGWHRLGNDIVIRISDDGKAHRIQIQ
jgi:alpha-glucosidase